MALVWGEGGGRRSTFGRFTAGKTALCPLHGAPPAQLVLVVQVKMLHKGLNNHLNNHFGVKGFELHAHVAHAVALWTMTMPMPLRFAMTMTIR